MFSFFRFLSFVICLLTLFNSKFGHFDAFLSEPLTLEAYEYVPIFKGHVHKKERKKESHSTWNERFITWTLSTLIRKPVNTSTLWWVTWWTPKHTEIIDKLRQQVVNKVVVNKYIKEGITNSIASLLFIDKVYMLHLDCFTFLHCAFYFTPLLLFI